jgi:AcrR family transcriptional regulator
MSVPQTPPALGPAPPSGWAELAPESKRARILEAAITVFAEHGLEAPMHEVAAAAGAGVASIYRIFPSKHDLWAAIVIRRVDELGAAFAEAERRPGDRWPAFVEVVSAHVARQSPEPFFNEARVVVEDRPEVAAALARATAAQEQLLAATRTEGRLRADVSVTDLRLLFAATRAARRQDPERVPRMLELMLDAFDTRRG